MTRIFLLLILFFSISTWAQDSVTQGDLHHEDATISYEEESGDEMPRLQTDDTLSVQSRSFEQSVLDNLKKDKAFDYEEAPTVGESLWDRFWRWVSQLIGKIFRGAVTTDWGRVLLYVGCVIVLIFIVLTLLKVDAFKVLFKGDNASSSPILFHENIHAMDFDALIKEAVANQNYRNAVRLVFLYSLKLLSDKQYINWMPGKTNHDYLDELKSSELKIGLGELSFYFDYAWYGGFPINDAQFMKVQNIFNTWKAGIR